MSRHHLLSSSASGMVHNWIQDGDQFRLEQVQDTTPILEANKAERAHNDGYTPSRELRRAARIPFVIMQKWKDEEGWDPWRPDLYADKLAQKLNDPEYAYLRTADGQLGVTNGVMR